MVIPGCAFAGGNALVLHGWFQHHAVSQFINHFALHLLPRRLTGRAFEAAVLLQRLHPLRVLGFTDENVGRTVVQVNAHPVAGLQNGKAAHAGRFRRSVQDGWRARRAGLAAIADAGQFRDAFLDESSRWLHVDHFRRARITLRPGTSHEQHAVVVDLEFRIVDTMVIIFRTVEYDGPAFPCVRILGIRKIALAKRVGNHAGLHDGAIKQIAFHVQEAGRFLHWLVVGPYDFLVVNHGFLAIFVKRFAVYGDGILVYFSGRDEFANYGWHAAGAVIFLAKVLAGRLQIDQQWNVVTDFFPVVVVELDPDVARNGVEVNRCIGRAANGGVHDNDVLKRFTRHDLGWPQILPYHVDNALPGFVSIDGPVLVRGRNRGTARQRHAQRLGQRIHGGSRAHGIAVSGRRRGRGDQIDELLVINFTRRQQFARFPDDGTGAGALAVEPAVQHRSAGKHDRRNIHGRGGHELRRGGLVAPRGQHHAVDEIPI